MSVARAVTFCRRGWGRRGAGRSLLAAGRGFAVELAGRPPEPAEEVLLEPLVLPHLRVVPERRVEHLPLALLAAPRDGVVGVLAGELPGRLEGGRVDAQDDVQPLPAER